MNRIIARGITAVRQPTRQQLHTVLYARPGLCAGLVAGGTADSHVPSLWAQRVHPLTAQYSTTTHEQDHSIAEYQAPWAAPMSWFPGHMTAALRALDAVMSSADAVIEVRDARAPLTTAHPTLVAMGKRTPRFIVYTKADLANPHMQQRVQALEDSAAAMFINTKSQKQARTLIQQVQAWAKASGVTLGGASIAVVGMPNTGKSSLVNALRSAAAQQQGRTGKQRRRGAAAITGSKPGVTRACNAFQVASNPDVYMLDSPGIALPAVQDSGTGLKLALLSAIPDRHIPPFALADVLLWLVRAHKPAPLRKAIGLTAWPEQDDTAAMLQLCAEHWNLQGPHAQDQAATLLVQKFRAGELGRFTIDVIATPDAPRS